MGRVLTVLLLSLSLTAFAQTTTPTKTTDSIPAKVNLDPGPAVVPGSSTPINIVVPTSVPGQAPAVTEQYQLATPIMPSGPPADAVSARPSTTVPTSTTATGDEAAVPVAGVSFASPGSSAEPASTVSVAEAAAQYKTRKGSLNSRKFDNSTLTSLSDVNPSNLRNAGQINLPQSDMSAADETYGSSKPEHAAAGDVLDPRDMAAVEAAMARSEQSPTTEAAPANTEVAANEDLAATRYEQMVAEAEQSSVSEAASEPFTAQADVEQDSAVAQRREQLPETGGMLPLVALLGVLALSGGGVALARARA